MNPAVGMPPMPKLYPVISPEFAMARGWVLSHPGREKNMYVDPRRMNPCGLVPGTVKAMPVITPSLLMPNAATPRPCGGGGNGVKVPSAYIPDLPSVVERATCPLSLMPHALTVA